MAGFPKTALLVGLMGLVGVMGLVACQPSPTEPTSVSEPGLSPASTGTGAAQTPTDDPGRAAQLRGLTDRLVELESQGDVSAQTTHELARLRALVAALTGQLTSGGGGGDGGGDGPPSPPPPSGPVTVSILGTRGSNSYSPNPVTPGGRTIVWQNDDVFAHRIVADDGSFDTGNLSGGASSAEVQAPAGGVDYHCSIHPSMVGTIGSGGGSAGGGGGSGGGGGGDTGGGSDPYALGGR